MKWVRGLTVLAGDSPGFWERNGYQSTAIPGGRTLQGKLMGASRTGVAGAPFLAIVTASRGDFGPCKSPRIGDSVDGEGPLSGAVE